MLNLCLICLPLRHSSKINVFLEETSLKWTSKVVSAIAKIFQTSRPFIFYNQFLYSLTQYDQVLDTKFAIAGGRHLVNVSQGMMGARWPREQCKPNMAELEVSVVFDKRKCSNLSDFFTGGGFSM